MKRMNHVERFRAVMNFQPVDRLPRWEWAMWWDQTIARWHGEGLPRELDFSREKIGGNPYVSQRNPHRPRARAQGPQPRDARSRAD
ncbi:MAG: hypothetical protein NTV49_04945 [Kiritimatiellaeota bacterium]|nr:hypothetical protein [Kiritimatiellota bacterium]